MNIIFFTFLSLLIYCYFGYPVLLWILSQLIEKPVRKGAYEPGVSVVLSVWNEEDVIERKLQNLLSLDYPNEKFEILIGSDGSTDRTDAIIEGFRDERIQLIKSNEREGKMLTINQLVEKAKGDVIVFTDARQEFARDAVKQLVGNFSDEKVGCVSGELVFSPREGATAQGINLYWNYEKFIRANESKVHSMLGATGAIYAIRKELFTNVPRNIVLDDVFIPFQIIQKGCRAIFDESAKAYDEAADSPREEHRRKTRTLFGNYQIFGVMPQMFIPFKSPIAVQLFSHKFLRVAAPFLMIALYGANFILAKEIFFLVFFILQNIFYLTAIAGALTRYSKYGILRIISKICYVPYVFCLLNYSAIVGLVKFLARKQDVLWSKARGGVRSRE